MGVRYSCEKMGSFVAEVGTTSQIMFLHAGNLNMRPEIAIRTREAASEVAVKRASRPPSRSRCYARRRTSPDRLAMRKGDKHCPVCCADLPFNGRGGRRVHGCARCGATYRPGRQCGHCSQGRVWQGQGVYCQACGRSVGPN